VHASIESFEKGVKDDDEAIPPSMLYAWAALQEGIPYFNGAPNLTVDIPAMQQLARERQVPIMGKDYKTGRPC